MSVLALARARVVAIDQQLSHGTLLRDVPWDSNNNAEPGRTARTSGTHETLGNCTDDPSLLIEAYHERVALCLDAGDVSDRQARSIAENEVGSDIDHLAGLQIAHWRHQLDSIYCIDSPWFTRILSSCILQLNEGWILTAVSMGWTDSELFGLNSNAPKIRIEAQGLVTSLAASKFKAPKQVTQVSDQSATIETGSGAQLKHYRFRSNLGMPIWDHPMARRKADYEGIEA